jgi:hypothetical protein
LGELNGRRQDWRVYLEVPASKEELGGVLFGIIGWVSTKTLPFHSTLPLLMAKDRITRRPIPAASCACWAATRVWRMRIADSGKGNPGSVGSVGRLDNGEKPGHWSDSGKCRAFAGLGRTGFVGQSFTTITSRSSLRTEGFSAVRSTPRSTSLINGRHPM